MRELRIIITRIVVHSRVGPAGVLYVDVPLGTSEANREFRVVVEDAAPPIPRNEADDWQTFTNRAAGSWQGDFERLEQGQLEMRDELP